MNSWTTTVEPDWREARRVAHGVAGQLPVEDIPLVTAGGRVLGAPLWALGPVPSFASSAMDGWAVAGEAPWSVRGRVLAGAPATFALRPGEAVEIATGAMIPDGASGVLRAEHGWVDGDGRLRRGDRASAGEPAPGLHVRPAGEECGAHDLLAEAGTWLTPPLLGLAAAGGHDRLPVVRRPVLRPVLLGDELVHEDVAQPGEVRDALGPQFGALAASLGALAVAPVAVPDVLDATIAALTGTDGTDGADGRSDIVVTVGGTANGPRDLLHAALAEMGGQVVVDGVAMRPGHPAVLAVLPGDRFVVGLPGNPLAAIAGMLTLLDPLLRGLCGRGLAPLRREPLAGPLDGARHGSRLVPVRRTEAGLEPTPWRGSGMLRGLATADAIAVVPEGGTTTTVEVLDLPW